MGWQVFVVNHIIHQHRIKKEVKMVYESTELPFDRLYFSRIYQYLLQAKVIVLWYSTLRGKKLSHQEKEAAIYLGVITPLYDDLYDEYKFGHKEIREMMSKGASQGYGIIAKLGMDFYGRLSPLLPDPKRFNVYMEKLEIAQEASNAQFNGRLSETVLRKITYDKGGYSFAIFRSILEHEWTFGEEEFTYHLGSLIQLNNDVFDLRKDHLSQFQTLVTETNDINLIRIEYDQLVVKVIAAAEKLAHNKWYCRLFVTQLRIITSPGKVCLDQLAKAQKRHGKFDPAIFERHESVCDMAKVKNLLRSFWYAIR